MEKANNANIDTESLFLIFFIKINEIIEQNATVQNPISEKISPIKV